MEQIMWSSIPNFTRYKINKSGKILSDNGKEVSARDNGLVNLVGDNGKRVTKSSHRLVREIYTDVHKYTDKYKCYYCNKYLNESAMKSVTMTTGKGTCLGCNNRKKGTV